jgi:hypothetical protein
MKDAQGIPYRSVIRVCMDSEIPNMKLQSPIAG